MKVDLEKLRLENKDWHKPHILSDTLESLIRELAAARAVVEAAKQNNLSPVIAITRLKRALKEYEELTNE